jgi:hypothetical protein
MHEIKTEALTAWKDALEFNIPADLHNNTAIIKQNYPQQFTEFLNITSNEIYEYFSKNHPDAKISIEQIQELHFIALSVLFKRIDIYKKPLLDNFDSILVEDAKKLKQQNPSKIVANIENFKSLMQADYDIAMSKDDLAHLERIFNDCFADCKANKKHIELQDFDVAKDRIILGSTRSSMNITAQTRKVTAYHEAGHALVGYLLGANHQPLYKVTITPRGPSLGHTAFESNSEQYSVNLQQLEAQIATQLAGRIAEELIFGEKKITTGAENDLKHATELAYKMVTRWGYSKRIGLIYNCNNTNIVPKDVIEQEVQAIIQKSHLETRELLLKHRAKLDKIAAALLEHETLDAKQIEKLMDTGAVGAEI